MLLRYWLLLPVGTVIGFLAMSSGVSGAALWMPVYLLWLRLDARLALWLSLFTILFGFGSGSYRNWRDGTYNAGLVERYALASVPAAIAGALLTAYVNAEFLVGSFGVFVVAYSLLIGLSELRKPAPDRQPASVAYGLAITEGLLTGLISVGSGVLTLPRILRDPSVGKPGEAVGSGVMIIFSTSLAATAARLRPAFAAELVHELPKLVAILMWAAPAVVIGGQIGPRAARLMASGRLARLYLSAMLLMIGVMTLVRAARVRS